MTTPCLHILFETDAADAVREALAKVGRGGDQVVALPDDLSFGPIAPPDPALRARWVRTELRRNWARTNRAAASFWDTALTAAARRVLWVSRRSSREYAGFLEFVWRIGDAPCEIVDTSGVTVRRWRDGGRLDVPTPACSTTEIPPERMVDIGLLDRARPLTAELRHASRHAWSELRRDNAALRVVDTDLVLRSAPISAFDEDLFGHVVERWRKPARIISEVFQQSWNAGREEISETVLIARLRALVDSGRIESVGDLSRIRFSEVRLPSAVP